MSVQPSTRCLLKNNGGTIAKLSDGRNGIYLKSYKSSLIKNLIWSICISWHN